MISVIQMIENIVEKVKKLQVMVSILVFLAIFSKAIFLRVFLKSGLFWKEFRGHCTVVH